MSSQTLKETVAELKNKIIAATSEGVEEALVNTPLPSEKCIELAEAISSELLKNYAFLKAVLSFIRCEKN